MDGNILEVVSDSGICDLSVASNTTFADPQAEDEFKSQHNLAKDVQGLRKEITYWRNCKNS